MREMHRDEILEAVERRRRRSTLQMLIENPLWTISEKIYLLYLFSFVLSVICAAALLLFGVEPSTAAILSFTLSLIPAGFYDFYRRSRIIKLEKEFPALLRDITLSIKSGMDLQRAINIAARGEYGALTGAIRHISNMMSWGVSFEEALMFFARKYPTPLIKKTVFTIVEASKAGGEIGEIMENVATDVEETKFLEGRRSAETKPYLVVCYVSFIVFLVVIFVLSHYFMPMFEKAVGMVGEVKGMPVGRGFAVSPKDIELYKRLFFHVLVLQGFFGGLITGKIGEGAMVAGLKHSVIFIIIAIITYFFLLK